MEVNDFQAISSHFQVKITWKSLKFGENMLKIQENAWKSSIFFRNSLKIRDFLKNFDHRFSSHFPSKSPNLTRMCAHFSVCLDLAYCHLWLEFFEFFYWCIDFNEIGKSFSCKVFSQISLVYISLSSKFFDSSMGHARWTALDSLSNFLRPVTGSNLQN